jgi:serine/threonine-protein kinase
MGGIAVASLNLGRYTLHAELASGGMATVYIGRLNGPVGFGRTVAIKRLHPHYAKDLEFVKMFLDEARLAARIQHPNVVPTLDVVAEDGELFLVLDFVKGESVSALFRAANAEGKKLPVDISSAIAVGALRGLDAAHEAKDERGEPLNIVHRDISPQNIIVGADGVARLIDFGVAKARARLSTTRDGALKGKIPYMAPEQLDGKTSRRTDVYSIGVVLWELLAGRRLFQADTEMQVMTLVVRGEIDPPSAFNEAVPAELDRICARALALHPDERYATAHEMAKDIDRSVPTASAMRVSEWMSEVAGAALDARSKLVAEIESGLSAVSKPAVLDALAQKTPSGAPPSLAPASKPIEAATHVIATVSSVAKQADQRVRDATTKMAEKAVRDFTAIKEAARNPEATAEAAASKIRKAILPLVGRGKKKKRKALPSEEPTRLGRRQGEESDDSGGDDPTGEK